MILSIYYFFKKSLCSNGRYEGIFAEIVEISKKELIYEKGFEIVLSCHNGKAIETSQPHSISSDVPQGSVISPFLFILFINDLLSSTSYSIFSFADDTYLCSFFSSNPQRLAYSSILPHHIHHFSFTSHQ